VPHTVTELDQTHSHVGAVDVRLRTARRESGGRENKRRGEERWSNKGWTITMCLLHEIAGRGRWHHNTDIISRAGTDF
jgi:hypothetical protein